MRVKKDGLARMERRIEPELELRRKTGLLPDARESRSTPAGRPWPKHFGCKV
jgi:hypothetical protein